MTWLEGSSGATRGVMPAAMEPITVDPPPLLRRTVLRQQWNELAYFHWAYEPDVVQGLLPLGVTVDTFDGMAWVGLIPFEMCGVRLGPLPPLPGLGNFIEINVRTYVTDALGGRRVVLLPRRAAPGRRRRGPIGVRPPVFLGSRRP